MSEMGGGKPPEIPKRDGMEGSSVIDARERFENIRRKIHDAAGEELSAVAKQLVEAAGARLQELQNLKGDPRRLKRALFDAEDAMVNFMTELDVHMGGRDQDVMSDQPDESVDEAASSIPPGNLGTVPLAVYHKVMDHFRTAREFAEVAIEVSDDGKDFSGSAHAVCQAFAEGVMTLYDGLESVPRKL
jgi:hypothetical protein